MVTNDALMRVFWPSDLPRDTTQGVLLGWRNSEHDMVVVTVFKEVEVCRLSGT
jgi:phosphatidylinositol N-acetylglucosaminyltransferase subunit Q